MPKRPEKLPAWATDLVNVQEPLEGKKDVGWLPGEEPPAQYLNWLKNLTYQWLRYLRDQELVVTYRWAEAGKNWSAEETNLEIVPGEVGLTSGPNTGGSFIGAGVLAFGPAAHNVLQLQHADSSTETTISVHQLYSGTASYRTVAWLDDLSLEFETRCSAGQSQFARAFLGLHSDPEASNFDDETDSSFVGFRLLENEGNWRARVGDGTDGDTTDTTVSAATSTWRLFRLEYDGADTPEGVANGGDPVVRCYVDGVLRATFTGSGVPRGNQPLGFCVRYDNTGGGSIGGGVNTLYLGPVRLAWNALSPAT